MLKLFRGLFLLLFIASSPVIAGEATLLGAGKPVVAAGGGCTEATTFLARTSGLGGTRTTAYTNLICGLVTDTVLSKLDALYIYKTVDATTAGLNLVSTSYTITVIGTPTFTTDQGYTGGSGNALNTIINPTATSQQSRNSSSFGIWVRTAGTYLNQSLHGYAEDAFAYQVTVANVFGGNPNFSGSINDNANLDTGTARATGLIGVNRSGASARQFYQNNTQVISDAQASIALTSTRPYFIGARNFSGSPNQESDEQVAAAWVGGSLSSTDWGNLYSRLTTFMAAF